ncbi:unnamed protein product [Aspergillus oryzae]|uniref:D-xylose reductase [NAD(P)H] n=2 Tax=Aspergillus oryzae TaxID=5062 RepID=A0AAN4YNX8_ASPOZ|nr:unnamed protein product [Aspergillus oryzae]GMF95591.1 unnamed protein product [Aspergillus oryzae]GMG09238.1 unnamed protein product [Aspergillus oryzae]GMG34763.1 unnamed protein product [Aspergillus oryzae]GMG53223.1 unnamed protein product [Aspergillus oryzae var. brunneus]
MAVADTRFKLNTGAEIPALGLGIHIDGAFCYQNEEEVGKGIRDALASGKVKREDLFVTTKLWCTYHSRVEEALEKSLKNLGLDYIDLSNNLLGNHPLFPKHEDGSRDIDHSHSHVQTWKNMEKLLATGKVKAIGVSNYSVRYLEQLLPEATVVPAVNQIENHPSLPQQEIVDFCKKKGIHITAYSPLGSTGSPLFTAEPIVEVAKKKGVTPATVLLSWHIARGSSVLAKSVTPSRIEDNRKLVQLDESDMATIAKYTDDLAARKAFQRFVYPPFGVDFGFPDKS